MTMTWILIGINAVVFALDMLTNRAVLYLGSKGPEVWTGEWYRFFTANFIHADVRHLAFNLYALYVFGRAVEEIGGPRRLLLVYFSSGLAGYALSQLANPGIPAVGASAALFGMMGFALHFRLRRLPLRWLPIDGNFLQIFVLNLILALFVPRIDHFAHLGGLIGGFLSGSIWGIPHIRMTPDQVPPQSQIRRGERWLASILLVIVCYFALSPLSLVSAVRRFSQPLSQELVHHYRPYFLPFRTVGLELFWQAEGYRDGEWQLAKERVQPPGQAPGALAAFWHWRETRIGRPMSFVMQWSRRSSSDASWVVVRRKTDVVTVGDENRDLIYLKDYVHTGSWHEFEGQWLFELFVDEEVAYPIAVKQIEINTKGMHGDE